MKIGVAIIIALLAVVALVAEVILYFFLGMGAALAGGQAAVGGIAFFFIGLMIVTVATAVLAPVGAVVELIAKKANLGAWVLLVGLAVVAVGYVGLMAVGYVAGNHRPPSLSSTVASPAEPVRIKDIRQRSVANLLAGNLRVIEGVAVNQAPYPLAKIKVRIVIADAYDVVLGEKIVYCGNLLTDAELGALAEAEIQRELSIQQGSDVSNERIAPNGEIPFMIVFNQEQAGAIKTTVMPGGADRVP
jgi:hypothetical protein